MERDSFKEAMTSVLQNAANAPKHENGTHTSWSALSDSAALKSVMSSFLQSPAGGATIKGSVEVVTSEEVTSPNLINAETQLANSEQRAAAAEEQLSRLEERADKEITQLTAELEATDRRIDELKKQLEGSRKETEDTRRNAARTERRATACDNKVAKLNERIVSLQKELAEAKEKVVDPGTIAALESRIAELMGTTPIVRLKKCSYEYHRRFEVLAK